MLAASKTGSAEDFESMTGMRLVVRADEDIAEQQMMFEKRAHFDHRSVSISTLTIGL
jgi:hypothetical protein